MTPAERPRRARDIPPLIVTVAAVAALALVLPSALRVPQQDPTPVLEFAPIPPQDEEPPADPGNLSTLALGSSDTLAEPFDVDPPPPPGEGDRPPGKPCYRDPSTGELRQTADPMAPPCVPYWDSDNGGETWQGVTGDEIRVLVYVDGGNTSYNDEPSPGGGIYIDIDKPPLPPCPKGTNGGGPDVCDHQIVRQTRALSYYFNNRFQTYGRHVHFWVYFNNSSRGAVARRVDAQDNWETIRPFAVLDQATFFGNNQAYHDAMAARGVLVFTSETALPNSFFRKYPSFVWGFWPDVERWADLYVSYVCQKVAPYPARRMGNPPGTDPRNGGERRFGVFHTSDRNEPGLLHFAELVKRGLRQRCDLDFIVRTFPDARFVTNTRDSGAAQATAVADFQTSNVTTVLYLGGVEGRFSQYSDKAGYYPEIVIAGDLMQDNNVTAREQNPLVWQNAWATHFQVRFDRAVETPGYAAYRETYPQAPANEARYVNDLYRDHFMLFQSIQVAGPELNPENVQRGFWAIPAKQSDDPYVASCFFDANDYSCVKDAAEIWWDPLGTSPGDGRPGCWRYVNGGRRFLAWGWEGGDIVFGGRSDPCSGYDAARRAQLG